MMSHLSFVTRLLMFAGFNFWILSMLFLPYYLNISTQLMRVSVTIFSIAVLSLLWTIRC